MKSSYHLTIRGTLLTLNGERKLNRMARAEAVRQWRNDSRWEAKAAGIPRLGPVCVIAQPYQRLAVLADVAGHIPAIKAAIDGLTDAAVLADDSPAYLRSLTCLAPMRATESRTDYLTLELIPLTVAA